MTSDELTISHAQTYQPWMVPYSEGVLLAEIDVPHILASHTVLHAAKTVGKLAAVFEKMDHTGEVASLEDLKVIGEMSADLVTGAMRLCNLYQIDIACVFCERIKEKNGVSILEVGHGRPNEQGSGTDVDGANSPDNG